MNDNRQSPYSDTDTDRSIGFDHNNILHNNNNMRFFDVEGVEDGDTSSDADDDDNDDIVVHDQMPTVEEIKMRSHFETGRRQQQQPMSKKKKLWFILCGILFICIISLGGCIIGKNRQYQNAIISVTKTVRISHPDSFNDLKSPQSQALKWMIHNDLLGLPLPINRDDSFVQRYIIAVLVFAVTAESSSSSQQQQTRSNFNLLSSDHECMWNTKWNRIDDNNNNIDVDTKGIELGFICGGGNNNHHHKNDDNNVYDYEVDDHNKISNEIHKDDTTTTGLRDRDDEEDGIETSITSIILPKANLLGELPPEVEILKHLVRVDLDYNKIQGKIPVMPYLTHLSLAYNELTGYMPDHFSEMNRLQTLALNGNALQGSIPIKFEALTDLKVLALSGNELTGGLKEIYTLTRLEELYLSYNSFEDRLSNGSFKQLTNLKVIDMKNNRISGPLPDSLWKLMNLEVIDFHHNALDGHINDVIVPDHPLKYFDVSTNILGGGLPPSISNLQALTHMDVSYNRLNAKLPNYLANMTKMKTLLLTEDNEFGPQPLPDWLRGMTDLKQLSFRLTSRTGTIPTWFGELTKLELLDLDWNHISGTLPTELSQLSDLKYLMLNRNKMTGEIPYEVSSLPRLKMLMVDNNSFTGELSLPVVPGGGQQCPGRITHVVADCGNPEYGCPDCDSATKKIACPCCTGCCYENQERCNMDDWLIEVEDEYRNSYDRYRYQTFDDKSLYRYVPAV
jgi:Leucine-rich repeat (LRR) protein